MKSCRNKASVLAAALVWGLACSPARADEQGPEAWWSFDRDQGNIAVDSITQDQDSIRGNFKYVPGVSGKALKFDGFTAVIEREAEKSPRITGAISVEAWVALAAYPWNWCPVASQKDEQQRGYFFGVDARGRFGLQMAIDGNWVSCTSENRIPLKTWAHISGTYDPDSGDFVVYLNGEEAGRKRAKGRMFFARNTDLLIGMNHKKIPPFFGRGPGNRPSWFSFDGLMDEIKIYDRALTQAEISQSFQAHQSAASPDFPPRVMPSGPPGPGVFGAYYAKLKYYEEWDALWPVGPHADVIIQFDDSPIRVVFWRGIRYSPVWVTENGIWMADQSFETGTYEEGCIEHMQDIHCRYSHVRIIENTKARVVVHWRYAPVGSRDYLWIRDEKTGWAQWVDEYYTFYPDGVGMRKMIWRRQSEHDNYPPWIQKQETIVLCHPGQRPEDVINLDFITLANFAGDSHTYTWNEELRSQRNVLPPDALIQVVNLKSQAKPFIIFEPGSTKGYLGGNPGLYSKFSTCNHWPVALISSDGRDAQVPDRASSFLGTTTRPVLHDGPEQTIWGAWMYGMTEETAAELAPLGKSWAKAPPMKIEGDGFSNFGYDLSQRVYVLKCRRPGAPGMLEGEIDASEDSPLVNACLYIENWGEKGAELEINEAAMKADRDFRLGHVRTLGGSDLVVFINKKSAKPVKVSLRPIETASSD